MYKDNSKCLLQELSIYTYIWKTGSSAVKFTSEKLCGCQTYMAFTLRFKALSFGGISKACIPHRVLKAGGVYGHTFHVSSVFLTTAKAYAAANC